MKFHPIFESCINCTNQEEVFIYLQSTLTDSILTWEYFVNWQKILNRYREIEVSLNILNTLIGKDNIEQEFKQLLIDYPQIICVIPILIACRDREFHILTNYLQGNLYYQNYHFPDQSLALFEPGEVDRFVDFVKKTGLLELFCRRTIKSIPDYVLGIEVGLDTNGRKNRGGTTMEGITEAIIDQICEANNFLYFKQATVEKIKIHWNIEISVDKSSRIFDFAINNQGNLYLIEVNFYGCGGSKLKATAGEYRSLFDFLKLQNHQLIWVTDGIGWKKNINALAETFDYIDYTFNLNMMNTGLFAEVIRQKI